MLKRSRDNATSSESTSTPEEAGTASTSTENKDKQKEFKVGDTYDPNLLSDYGGPLFRHVNSKLIQHDISTLDRRIIPPWEEYEALSEGTLVIATISIHTFIMPIKDIHGNYTSQERRVSVFYHNSDIEKTWS